MQILLLFAFLAGIVTILSPCILPILPVVLSGSAGGGRGRPFGIIVGFIGSFSFFTIFLTGIVQLTSISPAMLRTFAVAALILFGLVLIVPPLQHLFERLLSSPLNWTAGRGGPANPTASRADFLSGIVVGISTGLVWTPCVGPILASVIALALTGKVTGIGVLITLAYAVGAAIPLLAIAFGGRALLQRVPWLVENTGRIQKAFGVILIATAIAIFFNADRRLQASIANAIPSYGAGLIKIEEHPAVQLELARLSGTNSARVQGGKPDMGEAPELIAGGKWFNSAPLALKELRGKVVLVDFWTYTCINCLRTLPFIKSWYDRYKDKGLVIIGVHTPEFEFEKDPGNVAAAIRSEGIKYPVMQDNDYRTWRAYSNRYWPAKYLIDADGRIRYTHFGEGDYDETEKAIQDLLAEKGIAAGEKPHNAEYSVDAMTPELYLGLARMEALASPEPVADGRLQNYTLPARMPANSFAFAGGWIVSDEWAQPEADARLVLKFTASQLFLVMHAQGGEASIRVLLDGRPVPREFGGADVVNSEVNVKQNRLYRLIKLPRSGTHELELEFQNNRVRLYAFTFG